MPEKQDSILSIKNAMNFIQKDAQERETICAEKLQELLKQYNCTISPIPYITTNGTIAVNLKISALPKEEN